MSRARLQFDSLGRDYDLIAPNAWAFKTALSTILNPSKWQRWAKRFMDHPPKRIVDVGANIGIYSISFALAFPDAEVVSIEPSKRNYDCLIHNIQGFDNIACARFAADSTIGNIELSLPSIEQRQQAEWLTPELEEKIDSSLTLLTMHGDSGKHVEEVAACRLDGVFQDKRVDWLKIDVEGNESRVIDGAKQIIMRDHPLIMMELMEINQKMAGTTVEALGQKMNDLGYLVEIMDGADGVFTWNLCPR